MWSQCGIYKDRDRGLPRLYLKSILRFLEFSAVPTHTCSMPRGQTVLSLCVFISARVVFLAVSGAWFFGSHIMDKMDSVEALQPSVCLCVGDGYQVSSADICVWCVGDGYQVSSAAICGWCVGDGYQVSSADICGWCVGDGYQVSSAAICGWCVGDGYQVSSAAVCVWCVGDGYQVSSADICVWCVGDGYQVSSAAIGVCGGS
ncbi:hypothetical protein EGW08_021871 [Elysia chlorotica]|uniref:Uncharacterized protein n=1 Tax=Elysia chlorotica TaxID=188477 RepID=A0A3S0Z4A8_ELYCH|nr:hypothetical protein EGW08_021871 [Elysia chlorotica]